LRTPFERRINLVLIDVVRRNTLLKPAIITFAEEAILICVSVFFLPRIASTPFGLDFNVLLFKDA